MWSHRVLVGSALGVIVLSGAMAASVGSEAAATKCGPYFVYIDRTIYKRKGCSFAPCYTFSKDAPGADTPTVRESFTIVHRRMMKPRVGSRGRDIPRRNLRAVPFSWNPLHTFGTGTYIEDGGQRHYCVPY